MSPAEAGLYLEGFQCIVDDGAIAGAVDELPHAAGDGAVAAHYVRKSLAGLGARIVDRACRAVQRCAAGLLGAAEDGAFVLALGGVFGEERGGCDAQMTREALDRKSTRLNSSHLGISYAV